jgi:dipeptide/tripeptide permease
MSNPIINPLWIYLIDVLHSLSGLLMAILIFAGVGLVVGFIMYVIWRTDSYSTNYDEDVENSKTYQRLLKLGAIIFTLSALLVTLIPSEKVMYTMFVSSYVTKENIELTGDAIEDMVDYIFEKVDELGEDD